MERNKKQEEIITESKNFFNYYKKKIGASMREGESIIRFPHADIAEFSPSLAENVLETPELTIALMENALEELGFVQKPRIRLTDLPKTTNIKIREIRAKHLDRILWIEGIVRQASDVRPQVINAKFECPSCGAILSVLQIDNQFRHPPRCSCTWKGPFKEMSKEMVDTQRLIIEESPDSLEGGEQPRRIDVFLKEDLVDPRMEERTTPGSKVKIFGILKEVPIILKTGISTRFGIAIEANSIIPLEETFEDINISEEDLKQILELAADPNLYKRMSKSIAPSVYGFDEIKESILLQLFGGIRKKKSDGGTTRGDIHLLLVGDPGVAKSVILKFTATIAPKGRYVSGKAATGAGLTAAVIKDDILKGWSLEAGAMVLSNKGTVCIDEIEKMSEQDRSTMHEAMEQQCMLPNFKLMLSNGKQIEIGKFVDDLIEKNKNFVYQGKDCEILPVENTKLISTDFQSHFPISATRVSRHKAPKEFINIELSNGRKITVTPEHPCWIVKNGKISTIPAEELKAGEFFPIPSKINIETKEYKSKNDYLCKILGYHLSDGCYELNRGKKTGIQFWNNNKNLINDYKRAIEMFFKIKPGITKRGKQTAVRVISKKVIEYFQELNKNLLEKGDRRDIPNQIFSLPNRNIKHLIQSLYDGDGSVIPQKRNSCRISFVTQNRRLAEQVSDLLLRFSIQSSIFKDNHSNVWRLDISGQENLSIFLKEIKFLSKHKQKRLEDYCKKNKTYRSIKDIIPNCTDKINEIFKKLNISAKKEIGHSIDLGVQKHRNFMKKLASIALDRALQLNNQEADKIRDELTDLLKLANGYARWMKIKKVSKTKNKNIKWVYDVTVEPYHTFVSNGMILHNTVSISKANIHATLRAETTVLAAGNPKLGRFDIHTPIPQQIDISPALLSRFDIIFVIRDLPNKIQDEAIATHVLEEHTQKVVRDIIEPSLLKKYISYARKICKPKLTEQAVEEIKEFYVKLRNQSARTDTDTKPIPITARQLEGIVRLAEAHAKLHLSEEVRQEDARKAINLLKSSLKQVGYDEETKTYDIDRIATGISSSKRGKILFVKEIIAGLESRFGKLIPVDELKKSVQGKIQDSELEEAIEHLAKAGEIFRPNSTCIQKTGQS